jgi:membrane protein
MRDEAERGEPSGARGDQGRGRAARTPSEIPSRGWKDILWRIYHEIGDDRVMAIAAGVTYYALLALFPALAALVGLYGLFVDPATIGEHVDRLAGILPEGGLQVVRDELGRVAAQSSNTLGFAFIAGLGVALWSANAGMKAIFDALNVVYDETEKRGLLELNALSLAFTAGALLFVLTALGAMVVIPVLLDYLGLSGMADVLIRVLRWPALLLVLMLLLSVLYRYGPSREEARWRWVTWGSAFAAVAWLVASMLFSWYATNFGNYNATYGSLGAVIGFMVWIWISAIVILVGAEINAETEHQTAEDTTTGEPKPMGARGAQMADTVGAAQA